MQPRNSDKATGAALQLALGATQTAAAAAAGVTDRTLRRWQREPWWPDVEADARRRFLAGIEQSAMRGVKRLLDEGDAATVRWAAERVVPELRPPTNRHAIGPAQEFVFRVERAEPGELPE